MVEEPVKKTKPQDMMHVYPEPVGTDIFTRQYLLMTLPWLSTDAVGTQLGAGGVPGLFASFDVLQKKLADYAYVQMDVELEARIVCSKYHYGAVLLSRSYGRLAAASTTPWTMDWRQRVQMDGVILACNDTQACKMSMKWNAPTTFMVNSSWGSQIGAVYVHVFDALKSIDANPPATVTVQIWGRISRIRLQGPDQSMGPPEFRGRPHVQPQSKRGGTPQHEASSKAKEGILTTIAEATSQIAPRLTSIPIVGEVAGIVGGVAKATVPVLRAFGWNKPTDVSATKPMMFSFQSQLVHGAGGDNCVRLGERMEDLQTMSPETAPFDSWTPDVYEYCRRFGLTDKTSWTAAQAVSAVVYTWDCSPFWSADSAPTATGVNQTYTVVPTPMAYICQYFGQCRGSIRYAIFINCSAFIQGVLRITYSPSGTFPVTQENYGGDFVSRLVDVRGPTWVYFTVPYLDVRPWRQIHYAGNTTHLPMRPYGINNSSCDTPVFTSAFGSLRITVAEQLVVTSTAVNPAVAISIFQAAGHDFQLNRFCGRDGVWSWGPLFPTLLEESTKKRSVEEQCDLVALRDTDFPGLQEYTKLEKDEGLVFNNRPLPFLELLHRYSAPDTNTMAGGGANYLPQDPFCWAAGWVGRNDFMSELIMLFNYYRGGLRYWFYELAAAYGATGWWSVMPGGPNALDTVYTTLDEMALGALYDNSYTAGMRGFTGVEVPYLLSTPHMFVWNNRAYMDLSEPWNLVAYLLSGDPSVYRSVADDFGLCGALPPPCMLQNSHFVPSLGTRDHLRERYLKKNGRGPAIGSASVENITDAGTRLFSKLTEALKKRLHGQPLTQDEEALVQRFDLDRQTKALRDGRRTD